MSIEKVKKYFSSFGMKDKVIEFNTSSATVDLAANALGCEGDRIAKSLTFLKNSEAILIVMSGNSRVSNSKFKKEFGLKAKMLSPEEVSLMIGHEVGGVCPFAVNEGVKIYLDVSLKKHDTVFPACGSSNSAIELTINELEKYSGFEKWIDIANDL